MQMQLDLIGGQHAGPRIENQRKSNKFWPGMPEEQLELL